MANEFTDTGIGIPDRLTRLWAPYRMSYIAKNEFGPKKNSAPAETADAENQSRATGNDPFVTVPTLSDEDGLIVARGDTVYCVLNLFPYNSGHMMVVPYRKVANLEDLTLDESLELMIFAQAAIRVVKAVSNPDAVNVGFNLGRASGGSIGDHVHMHIVPRWSGDANFMTIIDGTKVLPQVLKDTRRLFAQAWTELDGTPGVATC